VKFDTLITNGDVVTERGVEALDVGIVGERIAALVRRGTPLEAETVIDAEGQLVIPGAVDIHFHCRAPAYPERGDFATETRAAAAGGVTTIFEMPISKPCCATGDIFRSRKALGEANAYVNFALYGAPGLLKRHEVQDMAAEGAVAFKIFTTAAPAGRDDEFDGLCLPTTDGLYQALQLVRETGLVVTIHAEDNPLLEWHTAQLKAAGRNDIAAHGESRPPHVEALSIASVLTMNEAIGANIHIAHVSSAAALNALRRFKRDGATATGETCPHYLFFTEADMERVGPYAKINPPLRSAADQSALWEGLADGSLMAVTTDHSPFTVEEKERARTDIWRTPPGAPGVEELLLGMMDAALNGRISLDHAVRLISTNGAQRFGVYPQKGAIAVGTDADIVIYDPQQTTTIHPDMLFSKAKACDKLYEGKTFRGRVRRTLVNGRTVFHNGEILGQPGWGKFVRANPNNVSKEF
jgi:allantoinase